MVWKATTVHQMRKAALLSDVVTLDVELPHDAAGHPVGSALARHVLGGHGRTDQRVGLQDFSDWRCGEHHDRRDRGRDERDPAPTGRALY